MKTLAIRALSTNCHKSTWGAISSQEYLSIFTKEEKLLSTGSY
ncbi:hypothetical protein [Chroococcidiopsis sp [FACHB-1243]]|nr:hypothetical protein [Chroococcidiopsis sp. [FACHB-1243]]